MKFFRLLHFGAPFIQKNFQEICKEYQISFDDFQNKIVEDTGIEYNELKSFWITGEEADLPDVDLHDLHPISIDNYLIIHFDPEKKEIIGMTNNNYNCYGDLYYFYEKL